jgi:hypothetical protein
MGRRGCGRSLSDGRTGPAGFLAGREVRTVELQLKTAQSELDATRNKWIEHRLAGSTNQLEPTLPMLEAKQLALDPYRGCRSTISSRVAV